MEDDFIPADDREVVGLREAYGDHLPKQRSLMPSGVGAVSGFSLTPPEWRTVEHLERISATLDKMYELMLDQSYKSPPVE